MIQDIGEARMIVFKNKILNWIKRNSETPIVQREQTSWLFLAQYKPHANLVLSSLAKQ